jgi:hypothetical protein
MTDHVTMLNDGFAVVKCQDSLVECARNLIAAYAANPQQVEWEDVQTSLSHALTAFGLPESFPDTVHGQMVIDDQAEAFFAGWTMAEA